MLEALHFGYLGLHVLFGHSLIKLYMIFPRGYLAPEIYRGHIAFASDIYSLGVIIMEILTGAKGYFEEEKVRTI